jgi:hypothetical protein
MTAQKVQADVLLHRLHPLSTSATRQAVGGTPRWRGAVMRKASSTAPHRSPGTGMGGATATSMRIATLASTGCAARPIRGRVRGPTGAEAAAAAVRASSTSVRVYAPFKQQTTSAGRQFGEMPVRGDGRNGGRMGYIWDGGSISHRKSRGGRQPPAWVSCGLGTAAI